MIIKLKSDLIQEYLKISDNIIVIFGSNDCNHCRKLLSKIEKISQSIINKTFIYVDCDKFPNSADLYEIEGYPTIIHFINQTPINIFKTGNFNNIKSILF